MKLQGKIKTILFKGERVSVLLEDARVLTEDQKWILYTDVNLVKDGKYKKGETWLSSFNEHIYQACRELGKGEEVEVGVVVSERGFKNIKSISLKLPEVDVNKDLEPPDIPDDESTTLDYEKVASPDYTIERPPKKESTAVDTIGKPVNIMASIDDIKIIRQTCIKSACMAVQGQDLTKADIVGLAQRLESYVLAGE